MRKLSELCLGAVMSRQLEIALLSVIRNKEFGALNRYPFFPYSTYVPSDGDSKPRRLCWSSAARV